MKPVEDRRGRVQQNERQAIDGHTDHVNGRAVQGGANDENGGSSDAE